MYTFIYLPTYITPSHVARVNPALYTFTHTYQRPLYLSIYLPIYLVLIYLRIYNTVAWSCNSRSTTVALYDSISKAAVATALCIYLYLYLCIHIYITSLLGAAIQGRPLWPYTPPTQARPWRPLYVYISISISVSTYIYIYNTVAWSCDSRSTAPALYAPAEPEIGLTRSPSSTAL